jgi:hypothetical protein
MRSYLIVAALGVAACGPSLQEGTYEMSGSKTGDTCDGAGERTLSATWDLSGHEEGWTLDEEGSGIAMRGKERDDGSVLLETDTIVPGACNVYLHYAIEIEPTDAGFVGSATITGRDCTGDSCELRYSISGEYQD